jgi:hypothetical protein
VLSVKKLSVVMQSTIVHDSCISVWVKMTLAGYNERCRFERENPQLPDIAWTVELNMSAECMHS